MCGLSFCRRSEGSESQEGETSRIPLLAKDARNEAPKLRLKPGSYSGAQHGAESAALPRRCRHPRDPGLRRTSAAEAFWISDFIGTTEVVPFPGTSLQRHSFGASRKSRFLTGLSPGSE
jgi:hypothetical protein